MKIEEAQKYCDLMQESKHRTKVIGLLLQGKINTGFLPINVESLYLQFRKTLELIAFGSLIANREKYSEARAEYASDWNAKRVLKLVERLNPMFYPEPINQVPVTGEKYKTELKPITEGFLSRSEFEILYDRCGGVLHSENPYGDTYKYDELWAEGLGWAIKIRNLLNCHKIHLVDDAERFYLIQMGREKPTYTLFEAVK